MAEEIYAEVDARGEKPMIDRIKCETRGDTYQDARHSLQLQSVSSFDVESVYVCMVSKCCLAS